ncbi:MAG: tRNA (guanine(46)-N(7))-methyltransferase TrmB [Holosporales bacterium]|jgi:tRNA (guanine-N7-)-methyltransferase|nr:tRNA (guanine(46)-N(7))-methyltransferase TrmB [Holosporales bacterium]
MDFSENDTPKTRLYGRRRSHGLKPSQWQYLQESVAETSLLHFTDAFEKRVFSHIYLEIGFGAGEHLLAQAEACSEAAFIGAEPFENGFVQAHQKAARLSNLFLHNEDVRLLLPLFPPASLDGVYVLFPDPWPKRRHQKRRLMNKAFLEALALLFKPGGELRFATDCLDYAAEVIRLIEESSDWRWKTTTPRTPHTLVEVPCFCKATTQQILKAHTSFFARPLSWPETRYECKALQRGRACCYLSALYGAK